MPGPTQRVFDIAAIEEAPKKEAVRPVGRRLLTVAVCLVTLILVRAVSLLLHEVGHGLTVQTPGGKVAWLHVWPGIEGDCSPSKARTRVPQQAHTGKLT